MAGSTNTKLLPCEVVDTENIDDICTLLSQRIKICENRSFCESPLLCNTLQTPMDPSKISAIKEDLNLKDENGRTMLHLAAEKNNDLLVESLLSHGMDSNAVDTFGRTPLHYAMMANDFESHLVTTEVLIKYGANPLIEDNQGFITMRYLIKGDLPVSNRVIQVLLKNFPHNTKT